MIDRRVVIDGVAHTVVAVMPEGFDYPDGRVLWTPLEYDANFLRDNRGAWYLTAIGRLKPGVAIERAKAEIETVGRALEKQYPDANENVGITIMPLHEAMVGDVRPAVLVLLGAVGFVLLIACANVANLLLARAAAREVHEMDPDLAVAHVRTLDQVFARSISQPRFYMLLLAVFAAVAVALAAVGIFGVMSYSVAQRTREIGIRMALGARRGAVLAAVVRQAMTLAVSGVALGLVAAVSLSKTVRALQALLFDLEPTDPATFAGVVLLLTAVALLAVYVPARRATRVDPLVALRDE